MRYCILFALITMGAVAHGQYLENYEKKALTAFHSKDYSSALLFSEKVIEIDSQNVSSLFVAGESARLMKDYSKSETFLGKIPESAKVGYYAVTDYQLATVKLDMNKKEEARYFYQKYLARNNSENNLFAHLATEAINFIETGGSAERKGDYLSMRRLPDNINSSLLEAAPMRYADKMFFTSTNEVQIEQEHRKLLNFNSKPKTQRVSRIYEAKFDYQANLVDFNPEKKSLNASNIALTPDASKVYYTLCKDDDYREQKECEIWWREREYEGGWGPPKRLPEQVNLKGYTSTQPTIGWDIKIKKFVLYFVSDRPGGRGQNDIWYTVQELDGSFSEPTCLPFNTKGNEVTPFFHQASQMLFFSSDGWSGKGGLDIFRENKTVSGEWKVPENLGDLLNSEYDDVYYNFHSSSQMAYFVSNRPGTYCNDPKRGADCRDIFEARVFVDLHLKTFRSADSTMVFAPLVEMTDLNDNITGSFSAPNNDNTLTLRLEPGKRYRFTVLVDSYEPLIFEWSTENISYFANQEKWVFLKRPFEP